MIFKVLLIQDNQKKLCSVDSFADLCERCSFVLSVSHVTLLLVSRLIKQLENQNQTASAVFLQIEKS